MPKFDDLTGKRFGKLLVLRLHGQTKHRAYQWMCRCDCGTEKIVESSNLRQNTRSCGCSHYTQGRLSLKHPFYSKWNGMIDRCEKPYDSSYKHYGGRGITVCERWRHFPNFVADMEPTYFKGSSLDRIDNDGNYEPGNCRWATPTQQTRNRRCAVIIDTPWGRMDQAAAAERIGMPLKRFAGRVRDGWTTEQLFDPRNNIKLTKWNRRRGARNAAV